jgi:hypothetical protein
MSIVGEVKTIITCEPLAGSLGSICGDGFNAVKQTAYILNESSQSLIESLTSSIDYTQFTAFFSFSFISVVALFLITKKIGMIIKFININTR